MNDEMPMSFDGLEKFSGTVEAEIYVNEENGYGIFDFAIDTNELVTIVGTLPYVCEGDTLTVGLYVKCAGPNAWGKIDDALLNSVKE